MNVYTCTVYSGSFKEEVDITARNQAHLKQRVKGLGYDRLVGIHKIKPER